MKTGIPRERDTLTRVRAHAPTHTRARAHMLVMLAGSIECGVRTSGVGWVDAGGADAGRGFLNQLQSCGWNADPF